MTKTCRKCGEAKEPEEFRPNAHMSDGLSSWCSACHVEATRRWRAANRTADNARQRARYHAQTKQLRRQLRARRANARRKLAA